jgi:hypothetical protein
MIFAQPIDSTSSLEASARDVYEGGKGLHQTTRFTLTKVVDGKRTDIGHFSLSPLPGCCGTVVSHDTYLSDKERGGQFSEPFRQLKTALVRHLGYSAMIATSRTDQTASIKNMTKSGYEIGGRFVNRRTGNPIAIGIKVL